MADYWVYQYKHEQPYLAWFVPAPPTSGSGNSIWAVGLNGHSVGWPTKESNVPDAVAAQSRGASPHRQYEIAKYPIEPGQYHSRIWRNSPPALTPDRKAVLAANVAEALQLRTLDDIFSTMEPDPATHNVYGHRLRHFLILACTEIEAGWAGVLTANGYPPGTWSTKDYCKLAAPMRLNEWKVKLASYPDYPEIVPFVGWDPSLVGTPGFRSTQALPWYDAYNQVKHNREIHLNQATLEHVISAAAGMYVMEMAQFGRNMMGNGFFNSVVKPNWKLEENYFPPPPTTTPWKHVNYPF